MKKLVFTLVVIAAALNAKAQMKFGVKAGLNFAKIAQNYEDSDNESKTKLKPGFHLGVVATKELSETLDFTTGLIYSQKGFSLDLEDGLLPGESIDGYSRFTISYLEVPLNFEYKTGDFRIIAGPYVALGVGAKRKWDYTHSQGGSVTEDSGEFTDIKFKNTLGESEISDDNEYFRALDLGLNIGLGYEVNGLVISANYGLGLSNITPDRDVTGLDYDASDFKESNRVISIGATYYFGN